MTNPRVTAQALATLLLATALVTPVASAAADRRDDAYGTSSTTTYVRQAHAFVPVGPVNPQLTTVGHSRFCFQTCVLATPPMLPAGAIIESVELESCDANQAGRIEATLERQAELGGPVVTLATIDSGVPDNPGCAFKTANITPGHVVDNETGTYLIKVELAGGGSDVRLVAVRLVYRLQVSPAPATATFPSDVPTTHPFFRFVEALARAGITGGCGSGSYCPDAPVTRGQMAVFLATALGLHFPN